MNYKLFLVVLVLVVGFVVYYYSTNQSITLEKNLTESTLKKETLTELSVEGSLFKVFAKDSNIRGNQYINADYELKSELMDLYYKIGFLNQSDNSVVVYPIFTQSAYNKNGFYDEIQSAGLTGARMHIKTTDIKNGFYNYYKGICDSSCLTAKIHTEIDAGYTSSVAAFNSLRLLGYQYITDIDIDKDPEILKKYDKVIILHNEYVTKKEFDAITQHPKVLYLYPNALYAEIISNYDDNTITLIRGHQYPSSQIANGFDWKFDNSNLEYDNGCINWKFYEIDNGVMLNCYPEYVIFKNAALLQEIKNYK
jgi:hypothetical protein